MRNFWYKALSEPGEQGTPSIARVVFLLFALASIGWITFTVVINHIIPQLWEIGAFVCLPYTANKAAATISDFKR